MPFLLIGFVAIVGGITVAVAIMVRAGFRLPSQFGPPPPAAPPFQRKRYVLSIAERSFFEVLRQALGDEFHIFVKVRLEDVLFLPGGVVNRQAWMNKVRSKHVDFVLCDRQHVSPLLVIELDDASHERQDVRERDREKDAILVAAGLPILRVKARRAYSTRELREAVEGAVGQRANDDQGH